MRFSEAIKVAHKFTVNDVEVYAGQMDAEWCVQSVPNGGYVLGLIVEASIQQQHSSLHSDPIHVTGHFLHSPSLSPFEIHIRFSKRGKNFTNLTAELVQDNVTKVTSHLIFGVLEAPQKGKDNIINLLPPSPYARRIPLYHHPSNAPRTELPDRYKFHSRFDITREPEIASKNDINSSHRTTDDTIGGGGIEYGLFCGFKDREEIVTLSTLPFLADISANTPVLLPREHRMGLGKSWFPTMIMTIEFKFPIPKASNAHSNRTVAVFSSSNFLHGKLGRHDMYTEIWTAPCSVGEDFEAAEGWRSDQYCLAVSTQMALTVPIAKNIARAKL